MARGAGSIHIQRLVGLVIVLVHDGSATREREALDIVDFTDGVNFTDIVDKRGGGRTHCT